MSDSAYDDWRSLAPLAGARRSTTSQPTSATSTRRDKPAMIWESFDGAVRELHWGELQDLANQAAHTLAARGVARGDRVAVVLPPTPEAAAVFFGTWKLGAILLSMSVLYGDDAIEHRLSDSGARLLVTDAETRRASTGRGRLTCSCSTSRALAASPTDHVCADTAADDPAQLYYTSGTTGLAKGIVHAHRYILGHEEFVYCHEVQDGERFHGMGEWAWAAGIAPLLGPWRLGARAVRLPPRGRLRPAQAARLPQPQRGHERLHDADRDARDDGDRGCRQRAIRSGSVASARRASRSTPRRSAGSASSTASPCSTTTGSPSRIRSSPTTPGSRCARGRWASRCPAGTCRSSTRTSVRCPRASAARSASAPARTRTTRSATGGTRRRARRRSAASGSTRRTRPSRTRTATSGTWGAPTT